MNPPNKSLFQPKIVSVQALAPYWITDSSIEARTELIDGSGWLGNISWKLLERLAMRLQHYEVPPQVQVFQEGVKDPALGIVVKGGLEVSKLDDSGDRHVIATLMRGNAFGEMSIIDGSPRSASGTTSVPTTILLLTQEGFNELAKDDHQLAFLLTLKIAQLLSAKLRRTSSQLAELK